MNQKRKAKLRVGAVVAVVVGIGTWVFTAPYPGNTGWERTPGVIIGGTETPPPDDFTPLNDVRGNLIMKLAGFPPFVVYLSYVGTPDGVITATRPDGGYWAQRVRDGSGDGWLRFGDETYAMHATEVLGDARLPMLEQYSARTGLPMDVAVGGPDPLRDWEVFFWTPRGAPPVTASVPVPEATDILATEIEIVRRTLGPSIDEQIKIADIGDGNVAVGVLHRGAVESGGDIPNGLVHREVSEVYYVLSGGGTLVTGGATEVVRDLPADGAAVQTLIGPSHFATSEGGRAREISQGDIVVIPAGLFHVWSEIPDHVTYLSIRPDPDGVLPAGYTHPALGAN